MLYPPWGSGVKPPPWVPLNSSARALGLISDFALREAGGTTVRDSASGLVGMLTGGVSWAAGRDGPELAFAGVGYVDLGTSVLDALNGNSWTIRLRYRPDSVAAGTGSGSRQVLFGHNAATHARQIVLNWRLVGKLTIGDENVAFIADSATTIVADTNYDIIWTYNSGENRLYLDGSLNAQASYTFPGPCVPGYILSDSTGSSFGITGRVSGLRVYSRALSAAEVQGVYSDPWSIYSVLPQQKFAQSGGVVNIANFLGGLGDSNIIVPYSFGL